LHPNIRILKPVKAVLKGRRENNGGNEPNQGTMYAYKEIPQ
jgi:hypothetical protein